MKNGKFQQPNRREKEEPNENFRTENIYNQVVKFSGQALQQNAKDGGEISELECRTRNLPNLSNKNKT